VTTEPDVDQFTWLPGDVIWDDDEETEGGAAERKAIFWDEAKHPRDPDGKFGDGLPDLDELDIDPHVGLPKAKAKPVKKGKAKGPIKKSVPGPIFSPMGDDEEIDVPPVSGPIFSPQSGHDGPPLDLGGAPSGPIFSPMGDEPPDDLGEAPSTGGPIFSFGDDMPDLGEAPDVPGKPPAEPDDSPRRTYGRGFVQEINQQEGPKEYTDLPGDWEMDRIDKIESNYSWFENLSPHQQQVVRDTISETSKKPTYVRMFPYGLGQTTRDGRMKNVHETRSKDDRYLDQRSDYEREVMGVDPSTPDEYKPIYGYVGDIETADAYGPVAVKLKTQVRQRTTATVGDSLNALSQPYGVDKLPDLSHDQLMGNIYGGVNVQNHLPHGSIFDYMEAQIHGGVSLDDIDEVHVDLEHGETLDDLFEPETLATLRDRGIPVIARQPDLGVTPEQLAKLRGDH
jgi:hypothetical protein